MPDLFKYIPSEDEDGRPLKAITASYGYGEDNTTLVFVPGDKAFKRAMAKSWEKEREARKKAKRFAKEMKKDAGKDPKEPS